MITHDRLLVRPVEGLLIRDPVRGDHLPDDGRVVVRSKWWTRRILDGDVVEVIPAEPAADEAPEKKKTTSGRSKKTAGKG